ncbi:MAG: alginate export family protein [Opitutales bacterium]
MKKVFKRLILSTAFVIGGASISSADPFEAFLDEQTVVLEDAVPGKFNINSRIRYEEFDTATVDDRGLSHRIRYGYTTSDFSGVSAMVEGETLYAWNDSDQLHFLDDAGDGTDLNQLWVRYADPNYGSVKLGRQIYTLDDHRFIGHVGWRQNIQAFDAATGAFTGIEQFVAKGFFLDAVNRVNGDYVAMDAYGANVSYAFGRGLSLTGFYYSIDDSDVAVFHSDTIGLRATGAVSVAGFDLDYGLSAAGQDVDAVDDNTSYYAASLSAKLPDTALSLGGGVEVFGEHFRTPLATVHKFNGWADKFAARSLGLAGGLSVGLENYYLETGYMIALGNGLTTKVVYHWFEPSERGGEGGTELDLLASYKINKYFSVIGKYGEYDADANAVAYFAGDKRMLTLELNLVY